MCSQFAVRTSSAAAAGLAGGAGSQWMPCHQTCASALLQVEHRLLHGSQVTELGMDTLEAGLYLAS